MKKIHTKIILLLILVLSLFIVSGQAGCEQSECLKDLDCIKLQVTCCPCESGGVEQCVPFSLAALYREKLKDCPPLEELLCSAQYNCKIQDCSCSNGRCVSK